MSVLKEGTKVKTTDGLIGCVEARYDLGTVVYYVVKMEDGSLYKYFADQLTEIEEEPEEEPTNSESITISRKEFRSKASDAIRELIEIDIKSGDFASAMRLTTLGAVICAKTEIAIFGEMNKNV